MADTIGIEGLISSDDADTSKDLYHILNSGIAPYSFTATIPTEIAVSTAFASTPPVVQSNISGLRSWTGSFGGRFPAGGAASGHLGNVTFASGYATNVRGFSITAALTALETTAFAGTPPTRLPTHPSL